MNIGNHLNVSQLLGLMASEPIVIRRQLPPPNGSMKRDFYSIAPASDPRKTISGSAGPLDFSHIEVPAEFVADLEQASYIRAGSVEDGEVIYTLTEDGRRAAQS